MIQNQAPAAGPDSGLDVDKQIQEGIAAFMQSQDPAIAVQVCTMLAEVMGIAPNVDPYGQGQAPAATSVQPEAGAQPMARSGMKLYRIGGRIRTFGKGGPIDEAKKKSNGSTISAPVPKDESKTTKHDHVTKYRGDLEKTGVMKAYDFTRKDFDQFTNESAGPIWDAPDKVLKLARDKFEKNPTLFSTTIGDVSGVNAQTTPAALLARKRAGFGEDNSMSTVDGNDIFMDPDNQAPEISINPKIVSAKPVVKSTPKIIPRDPGVPQLHSYESWQKPKGEAVKPIVEGRKTTFYKPPAKRKK